MYERQSQFGFVEWSPKDEQAAIQAMEEVDGTGVPGEYTLPEDAPVSVSNSIAVDVNERYRELQNSN